MSHRKTAQLMRESGVWVRYKKKYKATNSDHKKPIYDNELKQNFIAQKPDKGGGGRLLPTFSKADSCEGLSFLGTFCGPKMMSVLRGHC
jgi:hypothetical protein